MPTIHKYKVIALDVWGHGPEHEKYNCDGNCDGYTVNDAHYTGRTIEVSADEHVYNVGTPREFRDCFASDAEIIRACVEGDFLTADCTPEFIEIDGENDYTLYVNRKEDGCPLLQLERVKEES
jgi:hypothetical protein